MRKWFSLAMLMVVGLVLTAGCEDKKAAPPAGDKMDSKMDDKMSGKMDDKMSDKMDSKMDDKMGDKK